MLLTMSPLLDTPISAAFQELIVRKSKFLPLQLLVQLFGQRKRYKRFEEFTCDPPEDVMDFGFDYLMRDETFVDLVSTWSRIQDKIHCSKTLRDLVENVDPLTGYFYKVLMQKYDNNPVRVIESLYTASDSVESLLALYPEPNIQKIFKNSLWPSKKGIQKVSLENSFLAAFRFYRRTTSDIRDIVEFSSYFLCIQGELNEHEKAELHSLFKTEIVLSCNAWSPEKFFFEYLKEYNDIPKEIVLMWVEIFGTAELVDASGYNLFHILAQLTQCWYCDSFWSLKIVPELMGKPNISGITPMMMIRERIGADEVEELEFKFSLLCHIQHIERKFRELFELKYVEVLFRCYYEWLCWQQPSFRDESPYSVILQSSNPMAILLTGIAERNGLKAFDITAKPKSSYKKFCCLFEDHRSGSFANYMGMTTMLLGIHLQYGQGVNRDISEATKFYHISADEYQYTPACFQLSTIRKYEPKWKVYLEHAAELDFGKALNNWGIVLYENGEFTKAGRFFIRADKKGFPNDLARYQENEQDRLNVLTDLKAIQKEQAIEAKAQSMQTKL